MKKKYICLLAVIAVLILVPVLVYLLPGKVYGPGTEIPEHMQIIAQNDRYMILKDVNDDGNSFLRLTQDTYREWQYTGTPHITPTPCSFASLSEIKESLLDGSVDSAHIYWLYRYGDKNDSDDTYLMNFEDMWETEAPPGFELRNIYFCGRYIAYSYYHPEDLDYFTMSVCDKTYYDYHFAWLDMDYYTQEGRTVIRKGVYDDYRDADYVYYLEKGEYKLRLFYAYDLPDKKISVVEDRGEGIYILIEQDGNYMVGHSAGFDRADEAWIRSLGFAP